MAGGWILAGGSTRTAHARLLEQVGGGARGADASGSVEVNLGPPGSARFIFVFYIVYYIVCFQRRMFSASK